MILETPMTANEKIKRTLIDKIWKNLDSAYHPTSGLANAAAAGLMKLSNHELTALEVIVSCRNMTE